MDFEGHFAVYPVGGYYKPHLDKVHGQETPASVFNGQRLTGMTSGQSSFPVARSIFNFQQHGDAFGQGWSSRSSGYLSPRSWASLTARASSA